MSRNARERLVFWSTPAVAVAAGVAYFVAATISGHPGLGVALFALMFVFGAGLVLASRRSETVRGLLDRRDERVVGIDLRATAAAGVAVILAVLGGAIVELARGHAGSPYIWLSALAGVAYVAAVVLLRVRG